MPEGEPGFRRTCLRTFEPANARLDAARRAGRGGCEADGVVGGHPSSLIPQESPPMPVLSLSKGTPINADTRVSVSGLPNFTITTIRLSVIQVSEVRQV
jgi:hypothetical protein